MEQYEKIEKYEELLLEQLLEIKKLKEKVKSANDGYSYMLKESNNWRDDYYELKDTLKQVRDLVKQIQKNPEIKEKIREQISKWTIALEY